MGKFTDAIKRGGGVSDPSAPADTIPGPADDEKLAPAVSKQILSHPDAIDPNLLVLTKPGCFAVEQFKILRTKLLFPKEGKPPRSIMITSALPGEGKTFISANLAVSIAQNINEHVLLIDCDLRRPSVHNMFGLGKVPGLSEFLAGDRTLADYLYKTQIDKLTILPAGIPPSNPSELLSSKRMFALLEEVSSRYADRYVIVDSPPPTITAETNAIARSVDGILLVVRWDHTTKQDVTDVVEKMGRDKLLGTIANRFDSGADGYGYYKKYGYYS